jgi:endoglucanase
VRRVLLGALVAAVVIGLVAASPALASSAYVRVNQVGFAPGAPKRALLVASAAERGATFTVVDRSGSAVLRRSVGLRIGGWNSAYPDVYSLNLAGLTAGGSYTIRVHEPIPAGSPPFRIAPGTSLYGGLLHNALLYYEAQRDGPNVISSVLDRQPSHLNDERASIYAKPSNSNVIGTLRRIGGPIDASGGWFDAGDYLKFVETASYVEAVMLTGIRDYPNRLGAGSTRSDFRGEARFGLDWLRKMWSDSTRTLYYQVGVGDGNGSILGDHDVWRLPQVDDGLTDPSERYLAHRPVLRAGSPGSPISPNLAGRLAADFALCFQVYRRTQPAYADSCLFDAEHVFALANTHPGSLTTTSPYGYYPETEWRDDLELGATELYFALARGGLPSGLPVTSPGHYLDAAARWARAYLLHANKVGYDSLNLYDVSGLAHYELHRAIAQAGNPTGLAVSQANLLNDCTSITGSVTDCGTLHDQLAQAGEQAAHDPFGLGFGYASGDVVPHALGVAVEARLYDRLTGGRTFATLAQRQLDFALGANAWGSSFIVGAGSTFPHCLQQQVANLRGSLSGTAPLLLGATVDGPNSDTSGGLPRSGPGTTSARTCSVPGLGKFNGRGVVYRDNVADWPNVEPADDYTALTLLAFAQ